MIDNESANNINYVVNAKVLDVEKRYKSGPKHYVYVIQVTWANPANVFIIYRRYTQFFDLQCKLLDLFADAPLPSSNYRAQTRQIPFLPGKIILGRSQIREIALERKQALSIYCKTIISLPERISRSRPVIVFFQPLSTDVQNPIEFLIHDKKLVTKKSMVISGPSKLPTYKCLDDFVAIEKIEISLKKNTLVQVIHKNINGWWFVQNGDRTGFVPGAFLESTEPQKSNRESKIFQTSLNETYVVNKTYQSKSRDEISIDQGSFVTVLEKSFTGWWIVKFNNITGQFPGIYLTSCEGRIVPENVTKDTSNVPSHTFNQPLNIFNRHEQNDSDQSQTESLNYPEPELFYIHSDFIDDIGDCVSLQRGDIVEIHEKHSSGWWFGRRLKNGGDQILNWIPSAFLQKEPIFDTYIDRTHNQSSSSELYMNVSDTVYNIPIEEPISTSRFYQNIGNQVPTNIILKKEQPITTTVELINSSRPSVNNEPDSSKASVRDLVKRFNRQ